MLLEPVRELLVYRAMRVMMMLGCLGLASCSKPVEVVREWQVSPSVMLAGARISSEVESLKGEKGIQLDKIKFMASSAQLDGPFHWRFLAVGEEGVHQMMQVLAVKVRTERTFRNVSYPEKMLGGRIAFELVADEDGEKLAGEGAKNVAVARFTLPGELQLYPKADGAVNVTAYIQLETSEGVVGEWVNFGIQPNQDKQSSFTFIPTRIDYGGRAAADSEGLPRH